MLVAIGAGLTWRFARALNQVDGFAGRLVTQVREAEEKLKASFAREEERARAAALARERTRLMRDLHDGLGGQLVSIVALERSAAMAARRIGDAARAALKDLRLVIDSDGRHRRRSGCWRWAHGANAPRRSCVRMTSRWTGARSRRRACRCIPNCGRGM